MELLKVSVSLIIAVLMLKFQPKSNNERLMFVGLTFVVSYMLVKDLRNKTESTNPNEILNGNIDEFLDAGVINQIK